MCVDCLLGAACACVGCGAPIVDVFKAPNAIPPVFAVVACGALNENEAISILIPPNTITQI